MVVLGSIRNVINRVLIFLCIVLCAAMVVVVAYQVAARFVFKDPSSISEEAANICFVWMGLCASALLYGEKSHMNINFVPEKLGPVKGLYLTVLSEVATLAMAVWVLTIGGWQISINAMAQVNAAINWLPIGVMYAVVPLTGICVVFFACFNILEAVGKLKAASGSAPAGGR